MAAAKKKKQEVSADFLNNFTGELDQTTQMLNGYGALVSAVVEGEDNGVTVVAEYDGRDWNVSFKEA